MTLPRVETELEYNARIWRTSADPAEMVALCGGMERMDRERLIAWHQAMLDIGWQGLNHVQSTGDLDVIESWLDPPSDIPGVHVPTPLRADLLRCCVPPPFREQVECPECDGYKYVTNSFTQCCSKCQGSGTIPAPLVMDPRWLTSTVLDMARMVKGTKGKWEVIADDDGEMYRVRWSIPDEQGRYQWVRHYPAELRHAAQREADEFNSGKRFPRFDGALPEPKPQFDHMPYLAEALCDAMCDNAEIIDHCRQGQHCENCWVLNLILESDGKSKC